MKSRLLRLLREPLLHFLLLGFALFVYYDLAGENTESPPQRIDIERGQVQQMAAAYERTWSRPPTPDELDAMIEEYIREEVFYREALALGLDRDDPLLRRRLRMKLEFILEDLSQQDADDDVLEAYLAANAEKYRIDVKLTLQQVFLDPARNPELAATAEQTMEHLRNGTDLESLGDPTLTPPGYRLARQSDIARDFGNEFAAEVAELPIGSWTGPIRSPFGAHLVRVDERVDSRLPILAEIRDQVLRDYLAERQQEQKDLAYQTLRDGYEVFVEPPNAEPAAQSQ